MPQRPVSSTWSEDAEHITFVVRIPRVSQKLCTVVISPFFLRVNQTQGNGGNNSYLWEQDLLHEIDWTNGAETVARMGVDRVTIVCKKKEVGMWGDIRVQMEKVRLVVVNSL